MGKIAFVFPGQGSQSVGMGLDAYKNYEQAKFIYEQADKILGRKISQICFEGPDEDLKQTSNTQPAIVTTSIALLEVFKKLSGIKPDYVAGHSLGEYVAMYEAGVLSLDDTLKLIQKRADAMSKAKGGSMAAVLALSDDKVKEILSQVKSGYVDVANYNCPGQVVITGDEAGIKEATTLLSEAGAKRVIPLAVSGAFHSKKMEEASKEFAIGLDKIAIKDASIPVITNVDAKETVDKNEFLSKMPQQIYSSVYWTQSINKMIENGVDTFVEIGNGKVLAGLIKKISSEVKIYNVSDSKTLEEVSKIVK
jgi:[acyl-carrier-protein] S-malonyltransferase